MNDGCSFELLKNAVARSLPADDEAALHSHLEHCESCCARLEDLAGGEAWRWETAAHLKKDELDEAAAETAWSDVDFTIEHLEPSDDPGMLGRLGGYDVASIVGRGGMGVVVKAFDRELKRFVAMKVLAPYLAYSSVARKRFAREAQAAAAVVNPHVIAIHHVQPSGRLPFLVMPLLAGESLAQRLKDRGPLELAEVLRIGMQAAAGLAAAHDQGLVHRDVKPANIFLEKGVERVVITDFGLARAADDVSMTRMGVVAGTPEYMSPEQARGEPLDGRSDLFSLGCVLYQMATGVSPFRAESTIATLRRVIEVKPPAMSSLNPDIPAWFAAIVERLLSKDPAKRFASAAEVSELLEKRLSHVQHPTSAAPRESPVRHWTIKHRRKAAIAAIGAVVLVVLGLLAWQSAEAPDITGRWTGDEWGDVTLEATEPGSYEGTYTDTFGKNKGRLQLEWSPIERRFKGYWHEGEDRRGKISIRLVGDEIRGAWTTSKGSKIDAGRPALADLLWRRVLQFADNELSERTEPPEALTPDRPQKSTIGLLRRVRRFRTSDRVRSIVYSADGAMLAVSFSSKRTVDILDSETGKLLITLKITSDEEDEILASVEYGVLPLSKKKGLDWYVGAMAFSPAGTVLAVGTSAGQATLFNIASGKLIAAFDDVQAKEREAEALFAAKTPEGLRNLPRAMGAVKSLAFSPDGGSLAMRGSSFHEAAFWLVGIYGNPTEWTAPGRLKIWDVASGTLKHDLAGYAYTSSLAWAPDRSVLACSGYWANLREKGGGVKMWNPETGEEVRRFPQASDEKTKSLAYSPNGQFLAVSVVESQDADSDRITRLATQISLSYAESGELNWKHTLPGACHFSGFTYDGENLVVVADENLVDAADGETMTFLDSVSGKAIHKYRAAELGKESLDDVAFSPVGPSLAMGGIDSTEATIDIWEFQPAQKKASPERLDVVPVDREIRSIVCTSDGKLVAVAKGNSSHFVRALPRPSLEILDAETGKLRVAINVVTDEEYAVIGSFEETNFNYQFGPLAFSPDGELLAVGLWFGQVKLFNSRTGALLRAFDDEAGKLAETTTPQSLKSLKRAMGVVQSLAFSPDGRTIATSGISFDDRARTWGGVSFSGRLVSGPGRLKLWDVATGALKNDLDGHAGVSDVAFSPDGQLLASIGKWDNVREQGRGVILWNPHTGEKLRSFPIDWFDGDAACVAFSPNGKFLATSAPILVRDNDPHVESEIRLMYASTGVLKWRQSVARLGDPVAFTPDGERLAVLCQYQSIRFFDTWTGKLLHQIRPHGFPKDVRWNGFITAPKSGALLTVGAGEKDEAWIERWQFLEPSDRLAKPEYMPDGRKFVVEIRVGASEQTPSHQIASRLGELEGVSTHLRIPREAEGAQWAIVYDPVIYKDAGAESDNQVAKVRAEIYKVLKEAGVPIIRFLDRQGDVQEAPLVD